MSPLSAGHISDTRGVVPRGVLSVEEQRERRNPVVAASATSVTPTRPSLAPGVVPLVPAGRTAEYTPMSGSVVVR